MSLKIVATKDTLAGAPRLDGHRIGVNHILDCCFSEEVVAYIQSNYKGLKPSQIKSALRYAQRQVEKQRATE